MNHKRLSQLFEKTKIWVSEHHKQLAVYLAGIVLIILGGSYLLAQRVDEAIVRTNPTSNASKSEPEIVVEASPLTGLDVSPELAARSVTGVIIENSPEARPHSGLPDAGVIIEAIAEGGITRFAVFYQEKLPDVIGPVRSLRPYFNDFMLQFDATVAHVGGSTDALAEVRSLGLKDLDEFAYARTYWRDNSRFAPHNVYTSSDNLNALQQQRGFTDNDFTPLARKEDKPAATPEATKVTVNTSSYLYNSVFDYDKNNNNYKRSVAGAAHKDRETGKQISPDVVVVLQMSHRVYDDVGHLDIGTTGSGTAWVFQDGKATKGKWNRSSRSAQVKLTDSAGTAIKLNKGQTWFSILPTGNTVTY